MSRFTLSQMLMAVVVLALVLVIVRADGCGTAYTKIHALAFSQDGKQLVVTKLNWRDANVRWKAYAANILRTICLVDVRRETATTVIDQDFRAGEYGPATAFLRQGCESLGLSADGSLLFFQEFGGGKIQCCDLKSRKVTTFFDPGRQEQIQDFVLSQDRTVIASTTVNGGVSLLAADDARQIISDPRLFLIGTLRPGIGLSADNRWVAILDVDKVNLYDVAAKFNPGASFACTRAFAFGPRADQLAIAYGSKIMLCEPTTNNMRSVSCREQIRHLKYVSDDTLVVTGDHELMQVNIATGNIAQQLRHTKQITALAVSSTANIAAVGDSAGSVVLWDLKSGRSSSIQIPGKSGYSWTLPAGILAVIISFFFLRGRCSGVR